MSEPEEVSRRDLFRGWARSLADGVAEWVLPRLEQRLAGRRDLVEQLRQTLGPGAGTGADQPWRNLLDPPPGDPEGPSPRR